VIIARKFLIVLIIAFVADPKLQTYAGIWILLAGNEPHSCHFTFLFLIIVVCCSMFGPHLGSPLSISNSTKVGVGFIACSVGHPAYW
jgi:hypothetical protein